MNTIVRKEYYIVEVSTEIKITDDELIDLTQLDEEDYEDELNSKFGFKMPEESHYLGYIDIIYNDDEEEFILEHPTAESTLTEIDEVWYDNGKKMTQTIIDNRKLETPQSDWSETPRTNIKQYVRNEKIKQLTK